ncbi:hypothetical protein J4U01_gp008 [Mycobacterium phage Kumao]|uniref:Uncharacterized protein n=1 Tax=Mycobacterium phage Kumao TaxID=2041344 RepID=A0A2D1GPV8_9CAUD|nr:hypothetical protein J4U01_gp008 [Mycobacterium phage Kumao]ATN93971.1 hypothetical protein SEA_KUMAO_8 [Mycobacterium phage Kumao]
MSTKTSFRDRDVEKFFTMATSHLDEAIRYLRRIQEGVDKDRLCTYSLATAIDEAEAAKTTAEKAHKGFQDRIESEVEVLKRILADF